MKPEDKVFKAYFDSKKGELYFNQIKELSKLSDSSLASTLKKMVKNRILKKEKTKACTFYRIKDYKLFAIKFSELAYQKFKNLNLNAKPPLRDLVKLLEDIQCTIILFGSVSRKEEREESDIDLLIVYDKKIKNLSEITKKAEILSIYPLQISVCSCKELIKENDHLITQAKITGFPIKGEQFFYEVMLSEYKRVI